MIIKIKLDILSFDKLKKQPHSDKPWNQSSDMSISMKFRISQFNLSLSELEVSLNFHGQ